MRFEVKPGASAIRGRTVYDDGVARAAGVGDDRFLLTCSGHSVECDAHDLVEAMLALSRRVGGRQSLMEAARAVLEDIESRLPAETDA